MVFKFSRSVWRFLRKCKREVNFLLHTHTHSNTFFTFSFKPFKIIRIIQIGFSVEKLKFFYKKVKNTKLKLSKFTY